MDIRHLRTFIAVARLASVTKAAEALHITQPAVSGQIKSLEEELGLSLLSRTTSSVVLTQCGQELLVKAERVVASFGDFLHCAKSFAGHLEGVLRIGIVMLDPDMLRVGLLLREMVGRHPGLKIDLQVGRTAWLYDALRSSEIDAAIMVCKKPPKDISALQLRGLTYRLVAPAGWRERIAQADERELGQMPWIRMAQRSAHQEIMAEILQHTGIQPVETVEADHESLIRTLVISGVGISLVREEIAMQCERSGEMMLVGAHSAESTLSFLYPKERHADPSILATLEILREVWKLD